MKQTPNILFGHFLLTACSSAGTATITIPAPSTPTAIQALPTSSAPGASILWEGLQVTMDQSEITRDFINEFGSVRDPSIGQKFLWVHVQLKNVGKNEINTPLPENYSILYAESAFKPSYGHRKDHADYTALGRVMFPGQEMDAWLRFDIPAVAELKDLRFVFHPQRAQVGVSFLSPNYSYAEKRPTYVWNCAP
jgi:hypothetical protein